MSASIFDNKLVVPDERMLQQELGKQSNTWIKFVPLLKTKKKHQNYGLITFGLMIKFPGNK